MSLTNLLVPTYMQMLTAISGWLEKAQKQMGMSEAESLLSARLATDMFPLSTQIRFACVQAQEAVFRLQGEMFPSSLAELVDEGRNAAEHPGSIADAQNRISETIASFSAILCESPAANNVPVTPSSINSL